MFWNGSLSKALTDAKGTQHLIFLATGPELDRQGERMTKMAIEKFEGAAKAGKVLLTPSHDVPLPLGKSVDSMRTDSGDSLIDFALDPDDPLATKAFRLIEKGEWKPQVSIGAEHVTRQKTFDAALGKSITEIADVDVESGLHCALTFPGRAVYRSAGVVQALTKAFKGDAAELAKRGWPKDAIEKAVGPDGEYIPPTFAARYAQQQLSEELPDMLETLRWTIEDILSPWTNGAKPALLATTFREFAVAVGQEITDAGGFGASGDPALAKADKPDEASSGEILQKVIKHEDSKWVIYSKAGKKLASYDTEAEAKKRLAQIEYFKHAEKSETPETALPMVPAITEPDTPAFKAVTTLQEIVTKGFAKVEGALEALHKAKAADDSAQKATPVVPAVPVVPDTDPASAPHTGCKVDPAADNKVSARKAIEDRVDGLRKAIAAEQNPGRRGHLQQEHAGLLAKLSRMP